MTPVFGGEYTRRGAGRHDAGGGFGIPHGLRAAAADGLSGLFLDWLDEEPLAGRALRAVGGVNAQSRVEALARCEGAGSPAREGDPRSERPAGADRGRLPVTPVEAAELVRAAGRRLGFDRVAIGPADPPERGHAFAAWLDAGLHGTMTYLERTREKRLDPGRVLPGARAVVACALSYFQGPRASGPGHVARYAWGEDYHAIVEPRLRALLAAIAAIVPGATGRAYVDTGPLLERELAARAGLGWIGKNTMLLDPGLGSFFFIGIVLTTAELAPDTPLADRCGTCTRCLDACPTDAFRDPYVLDARRCIAYLTIEHRGSMPPAARPGIGGLAFGCDVCQDVCPWNRHAPATGEVAFAARTLPSLAELATLDESTYRERLRGSPLRRARRAGLARNAAVALGNRGEPSVVATLAAALGDDAPLVREHAAWALGRLGGPGAHAALRAARAGESDAEVRAAIDAALATFDRPTGAGGAGEPHAKMAEGHAHDGTT